MEVTCHECGAQETLSPQRWRCVCGGAWEPLERTDFDLKQIDAGDFSIWRYRRLFGLDFETPRAKLGVGWTPVLPLLLQGREVLFKLDYLTATASFKDRGTAVMINVLAHQGVNRIIDDSSGNAGASAAAYAVRAGIQAEIFVPAHASPAKQAQIAIYGANVRPIPGPRINAKYAAWEAAERGAVYASHAYHPGFLIGQQSAAWELWEQLGRRTPDWIVVPLGQGGNLLGYWLGFRRLRAAGLVDRLPRLVAVQPTLLAPLCRALEADLETVPAIEATTPSVAEGLAIAEPVRGRRLLQAIRETRGICVMVDDDRILEAQRVLAHKGLYIEPTSATAVAALDRVLSHAAPDEMIVVSLTESGLKGSPKLESA
jgi:threonine synthase